MQLPSTKQLQYFVALADAEHFGRAAEAAHVSQSAFSNAIKELEVRLDTQLVDRTNRRVTITATGQQIATQARLCLRDVESLVEMAAGQKQPMTGSLRLGVIPTIAPFLLPRALPKLRRQFPDLSLYLIEDQTHRIYERLMRGELDVLLLALPWEMRGVDTEVLFNDRFCLASRQGTSKVDPNNYRFNRLDADSVLLLEEGHCLRDHALEACKIRNTQKVQPFAASSLLTLVEMVDADLGITFLPEMAQDSTLLKNTRVRMHPLGENSHRKISLAWRKGSDRVEEFKILGEFFRGFDAR
ncbi:MAG: LysR substrate-binding domain-containing protein [Gammaproteobacteria bacterium]|nr:LysR substrate-binding domain-containing protein [Gammaproteobacteria bacterium]MDH3416842.1 LysR substrate-binding domain-containing protein [Gammaproteobacteria bacterium]